MLPTKVRSFLVFPALALALVGCGHGSSQGQGGGKGAGGPKGPPQVGYVFVQATTSPITTQLAGRVVAYQSSEVRPQVSGLIQKRLFTEGSVVRAGQPLYQIDASLYQAAVNQANANVVSARASAAAAQALAARYAPLVKIQAVSQQEYTNAVAQAQQGQAAIQQSRAALDTARINLRFTTVPAPISGRIGRSAFTVGALVTTSQTQALTTIQQLDPIYVDIQQSSADMLALRRALADRNGVAPTRAVVRLQLDDGSDYGLTGSVEFSEVVVDQSTGTVTLRARFANPKGILLPGMFARAQFAQAIDTDAYLVPQQAVSHDQKGNATLYIVGPGNKAVQRTIKADRVQGPNWVVTQGVARGDRIILQGLALLKPGQQVRPVPANTPQVIKPPQKGKGGGSAGAGSGPGGASGQGGGSSKAG